MGSAFFSEFLASRFILIACSLIRFLICFLRSTGSLRVQSKRATQRVALSETLSGCALGFFPEGHSYEPKTKKAQP
jgi:hypothetical protein